MKCEFVKCGKTIKTLATGQSVFHFSVNEAKRASAKLQRDAGKIGCGILRKVPKI